MKGLAIIFLYLYIAANIFKIKYDLSVYRILALTPLAISIAQLLSISLIAMAGVPPLLPTAIRIEIMASDAKYVALLCTQIQTIFFLNFQSQKVVIKNHIIKKLSGYQIALSILLLFVFSYFANLDQTIVIGGGYSDAIVNYEGKNWGGWSLLYVFMSAVLFSNLRVASKIRVKCIIYSIGFSIIYFILHGNRSEVLVQLIFLILAAKDNRKFHSIKFEIGVSAWLYLFFGLVVFYIIGEFRDGVDSSLSVVRDGYLFFSTISGAMWSQIVAAYQFPINGEFYGETYFYYIKNIIPSFIPVPWSRGSEISSLLIDSEIVGGVGLWGESYINFGLLGVVASSTIVGIFLNFLLKKSEYNSVYYVSLIAIIFYAPRYILYDSVYLIKLASFVVILILIKKVLKMSLSPIKPENRLIENK